MIAALALVGGIYAAFAPSTAASAEPALDSPAPRAQLLYNYSPIRCHPNNSQSE